METYTDVDITKMKWFDESMHEIPERRNLMTIEEEW